MLTTLSSFSLEFWQWAIAVLAAIMIGFAKTGVSGAGILSVVLMAHVFGGKASAGLVLPMLCFADLFAVRYYHRHANWEFIWKPLPWAIAGVVLGTAVGRQISEELFKEMIGGIVLVMLIAILIRERTEETPVVPHSRWLYILMGVAGGFATMIGNAAGPIWAVYLLSMQLPKHSFIGTGAWFFLILNFLKIPFQIYGLEAITWKTLTFNLAMVPAVSLGAFLGIVTVKRLNEKVFRYAVHGLSMVAAAKLLFF